MPPEVQFNKPIILVPELQKARLQLTTYGFQDGRDMEEMMLSITQALQEPK